MVHERPQIKKPSFLGLVSVLHGSLPHASAILRLPTSLLAGGGEVLGGNFAGLLGLGVLDFVEVHSCYLLFFCILIIAQTEVFVKPYLLISLKLFLIS